MPAPNCPIRTNIENQKKMNQSPFFKEIPPGPIGPRPDVPAQFTVVTMPLGRLLTTVDGFSVYTSDRDGANKSNCNEVCQEKFAGLPPST